MASGRSDDIPSSAFSTSLYSAHIVCRYAGTADLPKGQASGQGDAIKASVQMLWGKSW